jgi:hypothetical protein
MGSVQPYAGGRTDCPAQIHGRGRRRSSALFWRDIRSGKESLCRHTVRRLGTGKLVQQQFTTNVERRRNLTRLDSCGYRLPVSLRTSLPRRVLNPCYRRERTTTIRKYNYLQEAGGHLKSLLVRTSQHITYRNPYTPPLKSTLYLRRTGFKLGPMSKL